MLFSFPYYWDRFTRNMPFRMAVGKLGIRLVTLGRWLQVRYGNWNGEFRLKAEISTIGVFFDVHVSHPVTEMKILSFDSPNAQPTKQTPLVKALFSISGICVVVLEPYKLRIAKGEVFTWDELRPQIEKVTLEHLTR